jgi:hypothetical protein
MQANGRSTFFLGVIEAALSLMIVWYAWTWPKQATAASNAVHSTPLEMTLTRAPRLSRRLRFLESHTNAEERSLQRLQRVEFG